MAVVEGARDTTGADTGQAVGSEVAQLVGRGGEQVGVVGGDQRADEVEGAGLDGGEIGFGVVALVEDQGDGLERVGDGAAALGEPAAEVLEGGGVGTVAGIGGVQQGEVGVGGDQQGEADDAQGGAALLAVAALGEGGLVVEGVDEGEEVGGVEQQVAQVDPEVADHGGDQIAFNGLG